MGTLAEEMPETQPALLCSAGNVQEAACCPGTPAGLAELGGGPMGALTAASQSSPDDPGAPSPGTPQDPPGRRLRRDTPGTGRAPAPSPSRAAAPSRSRPAGALTGAAGGPGGCGTSLGLGRLRIRPLGSRKRESGSDTEPRGAGPGHAWAGLWRGGGAMSRAGRDRVTRGRGLCLGRGQVRAERGRVTRGRGLGLGAWSGPCGAWPRRAPWNVLHRCLPRVGCSVGCSLASRTARSCGSSRGAKLGHQPSTLFGVPQSSPAPTRERILRQTPTRVAHALGTFQITQMQDLGSLVTLKQRECWGQRRPSFLPRHAPPPPMLT